MKLITLRSERVNMNKTTAVCVTSDICIKLYLAHLCENKNMEQTHLVLSSRLQPYVLVRTLCDFVLISGNCSLQVGCGWTSSPIKITSVLAEHLLVWNECHVSDSLSGRYIPPNERETSFITSNLQPPTHYKND